MTIPIPAFRSVFLFDGHVLADWQTAFVVKKNYMDGYQGFSPSTRASLVDWMVQVHDYFRMQPDTLYLSVSVLDAFLQVAHLFC